jgi:hypothetical protein
MGNVHILYMAEMARHSMLLLIYTLEDPEKVKITCCNLYFLRIAQYGK